VDINRVVALDILRTVEVAMIIVILAHQYQHHGLMPNLLVVQIVVG
jgi:hypothetical protein